MASDLDKLTLFPKCFTHGYGVSLKTKIRPLIFDCVLSGCTDVSADRLCLEVQQLETGVIINSHRTESVCTSLFFYFLYFILSIYLFSSSFFPYSVHFIFALLFPSLHPSPFNTLFFLLSLLRWIIFGPPG